MNRETTLRFVVVILCVSLLMGFQSVQMATRYARSSTGSKVTKIMVHDVFRDKNSDFGMRRSSGFSSGRSGRSQMDQTLQLRFKRTIKIDTEIKAPITDFNFSSPTYDALQKKGFDFLTPVQSQSYAPVLAGDDVVARSRTGTGKTFAFGLPLIERLVSSGVLDQHSSSKTGLPLILILEPTRELAMQVAQELSSVCSAHRLKVQAIFGGVSFIMQERAMHNGVHILVATPGRMLDHISRGTVDLSRIKHVVLDEGDTMLEMGFQKAVESIILNVKSPGEKARKSAASALVDEYGGNDNYNEQAADNDWGEGSTTTVTGKDNSNRTVQKSTAHGVQMLLFSATMPGWICQLTDKHMRDPVFLDSVQEGETRLADTIAHYAVRLPSMSDRLSAVTSYVEDLILTKGAGGQTIVFCNTKEEADNLVGSNCFGQLKSQVLHGDIGQNSRQATIKQFKQGAVDVLVATDVAARGLDIAGVDLVVHTGPPNDADTYVHRAGRTGRAGRNGTSIILYSAAEERKLTLFENSLKFRFQRTGPPTAEQICEASAIYAMKRLNQVNNNIAMHFLPHARRILQANNAGYLPTMGADDDIATSTSTTMLDSTTNTLAMEDPNPTTSMPNSASLETLLSKCLAAISNRNSIASRSLLTGQSGFLTLQMGAVFRNGTTPQTFRDWQRLFAGVLSRSLDMEDVVFGKMATGRVKGQTVLVVDLDSETAQSVLDRLQKPPPFTVPAAVSVNPLVDGLNDSLDETCIETQSRERVALPEGLKIEACRSLPEIMLDSNFAREYSGGRGSRGGGGGGGRSYSSAGRGAGGRSWQRSGDSGGGRSWGGSGDRGGSRSNTGGAGSRGTWDRSVHRTGGRGH